MLSNPKQSMSHYRQAMKERKKKEITSLLAVAGPMEAKSIIEMIEDISEVTAHRYLDELLAAGHIRKVRAQGKRKNVRAYEFLSEYGAKTDMVSCALSHPLHQLTLSFARKDKSPPPKKSLNKGGC